MSRKTRVKRSSVWLYFTDCSEDFDIKTAKCNVCEKVVPYSGNTSNLWSHIRIYHANVVHNSEESSAEQSPNISLECERIRTMPSIDTILDVAGPSRNEYQIKRKCSEDCDTYTDTKRAKEINESLILMISKDCQPFSILRDRGFVQFVRTLNPTYEIPEKSLLTDQYLPRLYKTKCEEIKQRLSCANDVHLTVDLWTDSDRQVSFLETTAHYLSSARLCHNVLQTVHFEERSAKNLRDVMTRAIKIWEISLKTRVVVSDNDDSIVAAINKTNLRHIFCFGRRLNLIVLNALKTRIIADTLSKCRDIVRVFKSNQATELLLNLQIREGVAKPVGIRRDIPTIWTSTYLMLSRFLELQNTLPVALTEINHDVPRIVHEEWKTIAGIAAILKPLYEATKEMADEEYVIISKVIPIVHCIEFALRNLTDLPGPAKELQSVLLGKINSSFWNIEETSIYAIATLLDPRYKHVPFESEICVKKIQNEILLECHDANTDKNDLGENSELISYETNSLWAHFDEKVKKVGENDPSSSAKLELERFLQSKILNRRCDPIAWWNAEGNKFPKLRKMALEYLCIPATSVPIERIFQKTGLTFLNRRMRLQPKYVDMLTVLSSN